MNALIVSKIVEQLDPSFEQLKTLRLVCKTWTEATLHHWRNSCAVLTIIPDPTPFTVTKYHEGLPVSQFFAEFQDRESPFQLVAKPFSKYKFKGFTFDLQACNKAGGPGQVFWNAIGPLVESIYFEDCFFLRPYSVKKVTCPMAQLLVTMIPNVKHLVLNDVDTQEAENSEKPDEDLPVFNERVHLDLRTLTVYGSLEDMSLKDLFQIAPHLEAIKGVDLPTIEMTEQTLIEPIYQAIFKAKPSGISPPPLSNLKHLDLINSSSFLDYYYSWVYLIPPPTENEADNFPQPPLETLTLQLEISAIPGLELLENATQLNNYLFSLHRTLKTLTLYRPPVGPPCATFLSLASWDTGGEMTSLTELHLWGAIAPDFQFLKNTPNLKRLTISLACFEKRVELMNWIREHWNDYEDKIRYEKYNEDMVAEVPTCLKEGAFLCTELEYLEVDFEFPEESLRILGKWMPNLKKLKTILNGSTIPIVCEVWRDLTELVCLHGSQIGDSCVIRDEDTAGFSRGAPPEMKICDLKELERFQVDTYCGESKLTDEAILKGFLKMPGLKSVQICVNDKEMSVEAEKALREVVQFCQVIRNDTLTSSDNYDEDGNVICECDRCAFRNETKKSLRDDDENEGFGSFGRGHDDVMLSGSEDDDASDDSDGSGESEEL